MAHDHDREAHSDGHEHGHQTVPSDLALRVKARARGVRVWDSTAELRYLVLPQRPAGTDDLGDEELAALVTRDAMVGTAKVAEPASRR